MAFSGCASVPNYSTAKLARKGEFQVTPSFTFHTVDVQVFPGDEGSGNRAQAGGSGATVGAAGAYGITDAFNVAVRYEFFPPEGGASQDHFIHTEIKFGDEVEGTAGSIGYGRLIHSNLSLVNLNGYLDFPLQNKVIYCVSPQATMLLHNGTAVGFVDVFLNNSFSIEVSDTFTAIPQVGIAIFPLFFFEGFAMNIGIAGRWTF